MSKPVPPFQHGNWSGVKEGEGFVLHDRSSPNTTRAFSRARNAARWLRNLEYFEAARALTHYLEVTCASPPPSKPSIRTIALHTGNIIQGAVYSAVELGNFPFSHVDLNSSFAMWVISNNPSEELAKEVRDALEKLGWSF